MQQHHHHQQQQQQARHHVAAVTLFPLLLICLLPLCSSSHTLLTPLDLPSLQDPDLDPDYSLLCICLPSPQDPKKRLNTDKILAMKGLRDRAEQLGLPLPPLPAAASSGAKMVNIGGSLPPSATSSPQSTGLVGGVATPPPGMVRKASGPLTASGSSSVSSSGPLVEKSGASASAAKAPGGGLVRPKSGSKPAESAAPAGRVPSRAPSQLNAAAAAKAVAPSGAGKAGSAASSANITPRGEEGIPAARGARVPSASASRSQEALGDISAALQQMQVGSRGV
jgi:hypothetical protein